MAEKNYFAELNGINVNDKTEKKNGLTYLSWAWAWGEFKKVFPKADYDIYRNEQGLPYVFDPNTGYMCYVTVDNGEGESHMMWLPVMDGANNAMLDRPYTIKTKYKEITVNRATMFDVNKTIMRCLVKALAMFGLALYIYAGEDLPEEETTTPATTPEPAPKKRPHRDALVQYCKEKGINMNEVAKTFGLSSTATEEQFESALKEMKASEVR